MAKVPKKWRGVDGQLHHLVNCVMDSDTLGEVIVSKTWRRRYRTWVYHVQTLETFEFHADFRKQWRLRDAQA